MSSGSNGNIRVRDVPIIRFQFRLAGYPAIFTIRFRLQFRPKLLTATQVLTSHSQPVFADNITNMMQEKLYSLSE